MWHQMNKFGTAVLSGFLAASATGQCEPTETFKLTASDGAAGDYFGISVSLSGDTAVVGVRWDDDRWINSGSAYLFDTTTGQELFKLTASDGTVGWDEFGYSVSISGDTAVVGAPGHDHGGLADSGSAYVYDTTTGQELFELVSSDLAAGDQFGWSVSISGAIAVVGALKNDGAGPNAGAAYLFDTATGQQLCKFTAADAAQRDWFGQNVAISGTTVVVGAPWDDDSGDDSGSAYVFERIGGVWTQTAKLLAPDGGSRDNFGVRVAVDGERALVGAPYHDDRGSDSGAAYVFERVGGVWTHTAELLASDAGADDLFGHSLSIGADTAVVGALYDNDRGDSSGSAYVFKRVGDLWTQTAKLLASDGAAGDRFGRSVSISGDTAIVCASQDDDAGEDSGSAYIFDLCASCPADFDGNGVVDTRDVLAFLNAWTTQDPRADFNGDGAIDTRDVLAFLNAWTAGCERE